MKRVHWETCPQSPAALDCRGKGGDTPGEPGPGPVWCPSLYQHLELFSGKPRLHFPTWALPGGPSPDCHHMSNKGKGGSRPRTGGREAGPPGRCCRGGGRGPGFLPGFAPPEAMMALGKLFISFALLAQRKFKYQLLAIQSFTRDTLNAYSVPGWAL